MSYPASRYDFSGRDHYRYIMPDGQQRLTVLH